MQKKTGFTYVCEVCAASFYVKRSAALRRKNVRFCSWACTVKERATHRHELRCKTCDAPFIAHDCRPNAQYCSISCGVSARNRTDQNPARNRDISGANNPMYGNGRKGSENGMYGRTGPLNPNWHGGRKVRADGYTLVRVNREYILEHRLVMEQHLGRPLDPAEVVHHIDENPQNNAVENLRLYASQSEHIRDGHSH